MKQGIALFMACVILLGAVGCASTGDTAGAELPTPDQGTVNEAVGRVLLVYFSYSHNTEALTEQIQAALGTDVDVLRLMPVEPYDDDTLFDRAKSELDNGTRPALANLPSAETVASYDTLLVGYPIWWYDLPMPMWTFLEAYDLSGKTVIPYFTHKGSANGAGSVSTIARLCPAATVQTENYLSVAGERVHEAADEVRAWVRTCGLAA